MIVISWWLLLAFIWIFDRTILSVEDTSLTFDGNAFDDETLDDDILSSLTFNGDVFDYGTLDVLDQLLFHDKTQNRNKPIDSFSAESPINIDFASFVDAFIYAFEHGEFDNDAFDDETFDETFDYEAFGDLYYYVTAVEPPPFKIKIVIFRNVKKCLYDFWKCITDYTEYSTDQKYYMTNILNDVLSGILVLAGGCIFGLCNFSLHICCTDLIGMLGYIYGFSGLRSNAYWTIIEDYSSFCMF